MTSDFSVGSEVQNDLQKTYRLKIVGHGVENHQKLLEVIYLWTFP